MNIIIQEIYTPGRFYIHWKGSGYIPELKRMMQEMVDFYGHFEIRERLHIPLRRCIPGRYCAVRYKDGKWYRGVILKRNKTEEVKVSN